MEAKKYRPSNGTEGMWFVARYCDRCFYDSNEDCEIIAASMVYDSDDPEYPKEWVYDDKDKPICTKFALSMRRRHS